MFDLVTCQQLIAILTVVFKLSKIEQISDVPPKSKLNDLAPLCAILCHWHNYNSFFDYSFLLHFLLLLLVLGACTTKQMLLQPAQS